MVVQQHTAMTISWLQAKIFHYYLTVNLGVYELQHGKIKIPATLVPPEPPPPTGDLANDAAAQQFYEFFRMHWQKFVESLK